MELGKVADSGCLKDCEKYKIPFSKCYEYCSEHSEFIVPEDPEKLNDLGRILNIHPVCILCSRECKKPYSFWSFQMPPDEYCDDFVGVDDEV